MTEHDLFRGRRILFAGALLYPLWGLALRLSEPPPIDPLWARAAIPLLAAAVVASSFAPLGRVRESGEAVFLNPAAEGMTGVCADSPEAGISPRSRRSA